jgi:hypothetical protein
VENLELKSAAGKKTLYRFFMFAAFSGIVHLMFFHARGSGIGSPIRSVPA